MGWARGSAGPSLGVLLAAGAALRAGLVAFGLWQDGALEVPYTDIDYWCVQCTLRRSRPSPRPRLTARSRTGSPATLTRVYTDAARHALAGRSPFTQAPDNVCQSEACAYRYTPLIAYLVAPNVLLHATWGKALFCAADLVVAGLIHRVVARAGHGPGWARAAAAVWLFNPYTFAISTRGSSDSVSSCLILGMLALLQEGRVVGAAALYGTAVHVRVFPAIYALPLHLHVGRRFGDPGAPAWRVLLAPGRAQIAFAAVAAAAFAAWTGGFFALHGREYVDAALLYHVGRVDLAHNFSPWFYVLARLGSDAQRRLASLAAFAPQAGLCAAVGARFAPDLPFALTLQTVAFVALNKVVTAQYFAWYLALLPACLPSLRRGSAKGLAGLGVAWAGAQLHWLWWAYRLEFKRQPVAFEVFLASCLFLAVNLALIAALWRAHAGGDGSATTSGKTKKAK